MHEIGDNFKVLESKQLVDEFLKVDKDTIRFRKFDGTFSKPLSRMVVSKPNSIGVLLYHSDRNSFLLVKQFRYPARKDKSGWIDEIVAGNIDDGETETDGVYREALEETGYQLRDIECIGQAYSSPGICTEKLYLYYSEVNEEMLVSEGGGVNDEGEDILLTEWSLAETRQRLKDNSILDLKTQVALQWFFLNKKLP